MIQVKGQDPLEAPSALFSNFLSISRVASDVQFEFVFLDLNRVVQILQTQQGAKGTAPVNAVGQTVAKVIMPAAVVVQLKDHIEKLMQDIQKELANTREKPNASSDRTASRA